MAASKPDVPISKLVDKILKSNGYIYMFRDPATQWVYQKCYATKPGVGNAIWRYPNRKYLYKLVDKIGTKVQRNV